MHDSARQGVAVGFFDGVHLGHRGILGGARVALTFRNHPLGVLAPALKPRLIMPFDDREAAIRACGVKEVIALDFTPRLAAMPPEDFAREFLTERTVYCGANWRFGAGGRGDGALLKSLGYNPVVVPFATWRGERVSSTRIRAALEAGEIEAANAMLGRRFTLHGRAFKGKGLGRRIGFPTINFAVEGLELRLQRGVYAVEVGGRRGVANFGTAPTLGKDAWAEEVLEVHLLDGACDSATPQLPDPATIAIVRFLRREREFGSIDELAAQIAADCRAAAVNPPRPCGVQNLEGTAKP